MEFALTALFIVLLIEQIKTIRRPGPFMLALAIASLMYLAGFRDQTLLVGIMASSAGCFFFRQEVRV
jgi:predicted branched-subunit amino acid permease